MPVRPTLILAALLLPVAVTAGEPAPRTLPVSYADLDLTSAAGQQALERRLTVAVRSVCAAQNDRDLRQLAARAACIKAARPAAMASMEVAVAASRSQMAARASDPQS